MPLLTAASPPTPSLQAMACHIARRARAAAAYPGPAVEGACSATIRASVAVSAAIGFGLVYTHQSTSSPSSNSSIGSVIGGAGWMGSGNVSGGGRRVKTPCGSGEWQESEASVTSLEAHLKYLRALCGRESGLENPPAVLTRPYSKD